MLFLIKRIAGQSTLAMVTTTLGWVLFALMLWKAPEFLDQFQDFCSDITVWVARQVDALFGLRGRVKIATKGWNLGNMLMITLIIFVPRAVAWLITEMHRLTAKPKR